MSTLACVGLPACEDDGNGSSTIAPSPVEINLEINALISGLNFVGTLPDGRAVNFTPAEQFATAEATNYADAPSGLNFTSAAGGIFDVSQFRLSKANLVLGSSEIKFQYVLCTAYPDLQRRYPDLFRWDPLLDDLLVFMAIGSRELSVREVFLNNQLKIDNTLILSMFSDNPRSLSGTFTSEKGEVFSLQARASQFENGVLTSQGIASDPFGPNSDIAMGYLLWLTCID